MMPNELKLLLPDSFDVFLRNAAILSIDEHSDPEGLKDAIRTIDNGARLAFLVGLLVSYAYAADYLDVGIELSNLNGFPVEVTVDESGATRITHERPPGLDN